MTRTGRILSGTAVGYLSQLVSTIGGLWLTAFLISKLGEFQYGYWLVVTQIAGYLGVLDLGTLALLPREVAYSTTDTDRGGGAETASVVERNLAQLLAMTPWVAVGAWVAWNVIPAEWRPAQAALALVAVGFVVTFPLRAFGGILEGLQDHAARGFIQIFTWVTSTVVAVVLTLLGWGLDSLAVGWVAGQLFQGIASFVRLKRNFPEVLRRHLPRPGYGLLRKQKSRYLWISAANVSSLFLTGSELLIVSKVLGAQMTVAYFCTVKLVSVLKHQPQMLLANSASALSQLLVSEDPGRVRHAAMALTQTTLLYSGAIGVVVLAVNGPFVGWWVGSDLYLGDYLTLLVVANMIVRHWNLTALYANFAFGKERENSGITIVDGVLTLSLGFMLTKILGPAGPILGSLAAVTLVSLPFNLRILTKALNIGLKTQLVAYVSLLWRFVPPATLALSLGAIVRSDNLILAGAWAAFALIAYAGLAMPFLRRPPLSGYVHMILDGLPDSTFTRVSRRWLSP